MSENESKTKFHWWDKRRDTADALEKWHYKIAFFPRLGRLHYTPAIGLLALILGFFAAFANYEIRHTQYDQWQADKERTFLGETPLFSTTDASYFLGLARTYNETGDISDFNKTRLYPNIAEQIAKNIADNAAQEPSFDWPFFSHKIFDFPLLSVIIGSLSSDNSTENLLKTGNALLPILGFVMALGILLAFGASGFWLEGGIAAIGAGLAPTYLARSSIGRIDTDILNLGFFYAVIGLVIFAGRTKNLRHAVMWCIAAALILNLFMWWYSRPVLGWALFIGLIWISGVTTLSWQRPLILGAIFAILSGLIFKGLGVSGNSAYFRDVLDAGMLIYPNTFATITEVRTVPFSDILHSVAGSIWLGAVGVFGIVLFAFRHPVLAVVYGPAIIFALANFIIGNRAIFYSAPMIWFGIGFLAVMIVRLLWQKMPSRLVNYAHAEGLVIGAVVAVLMGMIVTNDRVQNYVPNPSFPKEIMRGFAATKGNLPDGAVIATWWDYGYASHLFNGYNTLHDGGQQTTPVTHYFARSLLATSQQETYYILKNLVSGGLSGIQENSESFDKANAYITGNNYDNEPPVFLVLTEQMGGWMGSISKLGMWDTKLGKPINAQGSRFGPTLFYTQLNCQQGKRPDAPICNGSVVDLAEGTVDSQPVLRDVSQTNDGFTSARKPLRNDGLNTIHFANISNVGTRAMIMHKRLADSSFHQLFHLGESDESLFQLVYDDYPHVRIYALK